jgi:hypothetical protein
MIITKEFAFREDIIDFWQEEIEENGFWVFLFLLGMAILWSETVYVLEDFGTIQGAIDGVVDGDVIIVSPGIYYENIDFIGKGITVGSLYCTTQDTSYIEQTIVDGNQSGSVVRFISDEDSASVLSGLTIINGFVDGEFPGNGGGGIFCDHSSPRIDNIVLSDNAAGYGGGLCSYNNSCPELEQVMIINNTAEEAGGGIYLEQFSGVYIEEVIISDNIAYGYGDMYIQLGGGGIYCYFDCYVNMENVIVTDNTANAGGGVMLFCSNACNLQNILIENNTAGYQGGGMHIVNCEASLDSVIVQNNTAVSAGSIYCSSNDSATYNPIFNNVIISGNTSQVRGGGINLWIVNPVFTNVTIMNNHTYGSDVDGGGGMYCRDSDPVLTNVLITGNWIYYFGGGIYFNEMCHPQLNNVVITNNSAYHSGGGIGCNKASLIMINVTVADNDSQDGGGGIFCIESNVSLVNCILWNNSPREIYLEETERTASEIAIAYSDINGGEEAVVVNNNVLNWLGQNITEDPLFYDPANDDYHLQSNSPCIDEGTEYFIYADEVLVDLSEDEYYGVAPDMGAYEYNPVAEEENVIENGKLS